MDVDFWCGRFACGVFACGVFAWAFCGVGWVKFEKEARDGKKFIY